MDAADPAEAAGASVESMRTLLEQIDEVLLTATADHRVLWVSPSVRHLMNVDPADLVGTRIIDRIHPDDVAAIGSRFTEALHRGETAQERFRALGGDGRYRWVDGLATPRLGDDGALLGWAGSLHDITTRVAAEQRAVEASTRLATLAEHSADVLYALRVEPDFAMEYVSPSCEAMAGVTAEELYADARALERYLVEEDRAILADEVARARFDGRPAVLRWRLPDGRTVWTEHRAGRRTRADGSVVLEGVGRDVTAEREDRAALHASEERFRQALHNAASGMMLVDLQGRFLEVNEAFASMLGYSPDELVGMRFGDVTHPDDLPADLARIAEIESGRGSSFSTEKRYVRKDGGIVHGRVSVALVRDAGGQGQYVIANVVDVSETVRARQALEISEQRFRLAMRNAPIGMCVVAADGRFLEVNDALCTFFGLDAETLTSRTWQELTHPDDLAADLELVGRVLSGEIDTYRFSKRYRHADGTVLHGELGVTGIRDDGGDFLFFVSQIVDTSDTVRVRSELEARERQYRLLAENASDVVLQTDLEGRVVWVSPSAHDVLGYGPDELIGRLSADLAAPDDLETSRRARAETYARGGVGRVEGRFIHADGHPVWISAHTRLMTDDDGRPIGVVSGLRQIDDEVRAREELAASEEQFRLLAENASDIVARTDLDGRFTWVSPSVKDVLGFQPEELIGRPSLDLIHPDDRDHARENRRRMYEEGSQESAETRMVTADGRSRWMSLRARVLHDQTGRPVGAVSAVRDIDAEVRARTALAHSERQFRMMMLGAAAGMAVVDARTLRFLQVNQALCRLLDRDEAWLTSHEVTDLVHPDDLPAATAVRERLVAGGSEQVTHERRFLRPDGSTMWALVALALMRDDSGSPLFFIEQVIDITGERAARLELAHRASHDPLTGFANRERVRTVLTELLDDAPDARGGVAVLYADLDNFKVVNDSLGHAAGDEVLAIVAERVKRALRPHDTVGRVGGDEFVVVLDGVRSAAEAEDVAERVREAVRQEVQVQGHRLLPSISIGVTVAAVPASADDVLRDADTALYRAKELGRDRWVVFDQGMRADAFSRLTVEADLRRALEAGEVVVHFQPVVRLPDGIPVGREALVRWQHPERGLLPPGAFLDVAEASGLIVPLGQRVLTLVAERLAARPDESRVSVNVSPAEISRAGWAESVRGILRDSGVDPQRIVLEVTETAILRMAPALRRDLKELTDMGLRFVVDDFGTGFSSISLLRDLPVVGVKLDMSFTQGLTPHDSPANRLVEGIAGLVTGLGLIGIAEGVETQEQADLLAWMGWTYAQGYLFGRPSPDGGTDYSGRST